MQRVRVYPVYYIIYVLAGAVYTRYVVGLARRFFNRTKSNHTANTTRRYII